MSYYVETPLLKQEFKGLGSSGPQFYLKYECLQPSRSFKARGIGHLIESEAEKAKEDGSKLHVFSSSGGNAGLAAAVASKMMNIDCTVVVPRTAQPHMIAKIEKADASVIVHGDHWKMADDYLKETVMKDLPTEIKPLYVHPFDDSRIWQGHSTMIDEIVEQITKQGHSLLDVKGIVCSVGGGGLYSGVITGLERHGLADQIPVIAVETVGADSMTRSLEAGKPVTLTEIRSVASCLGSTYTVPSALDNAVKYNTRCFAQEDNKAVEACFNFLDDRNILVEPACAASLSLCYQNGKLNQILGRELTENDIIVVIVCGGSGVTISDLERMREQLQESL